MRPAPVKNTVLDRGTFDQLWRDWLRDLVDRTNDSTVSTDTVPTGVSIAITAPVNETVTLSAYAPAPFTITALMQARLSAGSLTAAVAINGTPVTGLSVVAVTTTPSDTSATGANTVATGDVVTLTISGVSGATDFLASLVGTRALVPA